MCQVSEKNSSVMSILVIFSLHFHTHAFLVRYILSPPPRLYRKRRHRSRGTTVNAVPIPAVTVVCVIKFNPITAIVRSKFENFAMGDRSPPLGSRSKPQYGVLRQSPRSWSSLQTLMIDFDRKTITIWQFCTIHLLILDEYVSRCGGGKRHFGGLAPLAHVAPPLIYIFIKFFYYQEISCLLLSD